MADPECAPPDARDLEEQLGGGLLHRIKMSTNLAETLLTGSPAVEIRHQHTPMYDPVFRFDDEALATPSRDPPTRLAIALRAPMPPRSVRQGRRRDVAFIGLVHPGAPTTSTTRPTSTRA